MLATSLVLDKYHTCCTREVVAVRAMCFRKVTHHMAAQLGLRCTSHPIMHRGVVRASLALTWPS